MKHKTRLAIAVALVTASAAATAQMGDMKGMDMPMKDMPMKDMPMKQLPAADQVHKATGTVNKIDHAKGVVTFAHGPVASMGWPAMTMGFRVKDAKLLDGLAVGRQVEFDFVKEGSAYVVTAVR